MVNERQSGAPPRDYVVRAAALEGFMPLMRELGVDGPGLLTRAGIDVSVLMHPDHNISYIGFMKALALARDETGHQHIGLMLAERQSISMFGHLGLAIAEAPDVGTAITQLNSYYHLHATGNMGRLVVEGDLAMWRYEVLASDVPGVRQQEDLAVAIGINMLRRMVGRDWNPELVTLQRRAPQSAAPWRAMFRCPVEFEAEYNQGVFDRAILDRKLNHSNSQLHLLLNQHLKRLDAIGRRDWRADTQQSILHAMKAGDCSLEAVAKLMNVSPRTLQRRLQALGRSFRDELEDVRTRAACRYLEETTIPLTSLAFTLGYSDLPAFSHAFKRLTGETPRDWRKGRALKG